MKLIVNRYLKFSILGYFLVFCHVNFCMQPTKEDSIFFELLVKDPHMAALFLKKERDQLLSSLSAFRWPLLPPEPAMRQQLAATLSDMNRLPLFLDLCTDEGCCIQADDRREYTQQLAAAYLEIFLEQKKSIKVLDYACGSLLQTIVPILMAIKKSSSLPGRLPDKITFLLLDLTLNQGDEKIMTYTPEFVQGGISPFNWTLLDFRRFLQKIAPGIEWDIKLFKSVDIYKNAMHKDVEEYTPDIITAIDFYHDISFSFNANEQQSEENLKHLEAAIRKNNPKLKSVIYHCKCLEPKTKLKKLHP